MQLMKTIGFEIITILHISILFDFERSLSLFRGGIKCLVYGLAKSSSNNILDEWTGSVI